MPIVFCVNVSAREIFVAPNGTATADGSRTQPLDVVTALSSKSPAKPGDTVLLIGGQYDGPMDGIKRVPFSCKTAGTAESPIRVMPAPGGAAHLNGALAITGSFTHYIGLEIGDLKWEPTQKIHHAPFVVNATEGNGVKLINCNIFGGEMGCRCWEDAKNLEIYGCVIHDLGNIGADGKGGGHAFYARNLEGTKVFEHNLAYRGCGWNVYLYTHANHIVGVDVLENICYLPGGGVAGKSYDNFLLQADPAVDVGSPGTELEFAL